MDSELRWQNVIFWIRPPVGEMVWAFEAKGVIGPDEKLHVVLDPPDFIELTGFVNDLAEGMKEMSIDDEPPKNHQEGTE